MLRIGKDGCGDNDDSQHDTKIQVRLITLVLLYTECDKAKDGSRPEEIIEQASHAQQEPDVPGQALFLCELIRSIDFETLRRFFFSETKEVGLSRHLQLGVKLVCESFHANYVFSLNDNGDSLLSHI